MKILLGDELLEFSEDELDYMYIDEGNESEVYRYGKDVLKIYKKFCYKDRLSEEDTIRLSQISTKRFLLPKQIIKDPDDGHFMGYSLPFVYRYPSSVIPRLSMIKLLDELDVVCEDIDVLSKHGVDIEDLHVDNVLFNDKFFIGDPGSFVFRKNLAELRLYRDNIFTFNRFIKEMFFQLVPLSKSKRESFDDMFDDYFYIGDQMRYDVKNDKESVKSFIKRMTR